MWLLLHTLSVRTEHEHAVTHPMTEISSSHLLIKMPTARALLRLLLFFLALRPSLAAHRRRILHQPFQPQDSSPPTKPPVPSPPSPPKYPFSGSTPPAADPDSPFFPTYPSSPLPPPSSSSQASFPANVSSISVPRTSGPNSAPSKLVVAAIAAVIAAVAVVSLAAFLHLRRRGRSRGSSSFDRSKTHRSDSSSAVSFSNHLQHIPKLQRPPQTSSEFLYLGTLVSSHAPGGAFNGAGAANDQNSASSDSRKTDSPELRPLPPLNTRQVFRASSGDAANGETEEFYSPKGSIGAGSASRRAFAAVDVGNFDGSASPTYSSSVPGSGPGSPVGSVSSRYSIPDSPDLIEIQTITPSSSSPEKYSRRSVESSPRISGNNTESQSPVRISTDILTPPETGGSLFAEPAPALSYSRRSEESESAPMNSGFSDLKSESLVSTVNSNIPTLPEPPPSSSSPERHPKSPPRIPTDSDPEIKSPARISSPIQTNTVEIPIPPPAETQLVMFQDSASSPNRCSTKCEQSSPDNLNVDSPEVMAQTSSTFTPSPTPPPMQNSEFAVQRSEESSPRVSVGSDQNVESPIRIQHNATTFIPPPPPPPPSKVWESPNTPTPPAKRPVVPPSLINPLRPIFLESPTPISPIELPSDVNGESPMRIQHNATTFIPPPPPLPPRKVWDSPKTPTPPAKMPVVPPRLINPLRPIFLESPTSISPIELPSDPNGESPMRIQYNATAFIPPPPPLPPRKVWDSPKTPTPPAKKPIVPPCLINPLRPLSLESPTSISPMELPLNDPQVDKNDDNKETENSREDADHNGDNNSNTIKPKLKQLHWDKVRASSDREMVWDQFKCSSFKLNEEMIETLFVVNTPKPKPNPNETTRWQVLPSPGQDNGSRVLDPKKAQNIAILLKALHVTVDEVCEGLLEGNADILGTDFLESLLKMAPSKEEERKLQEYKDDDDNDSPNKLGAAERFLKAVVDIPYAFKRVDAMLYISNFDSEVEYLKKSFTTLESACEELRSSRMFLKLLEAVLKTGNRMNVGTNRGDAHAFKLDTLLKLADVKAADGKTTLLHFVVQEIIRTEGARPSDVSHHHETHSSSTNNDDARCRKLGLRVVSSLSSDLSNVKKAAVMDAEVLSADVSKLSKGIENVKEMISDIALDGGDKFLENMSSFMRRGEEEIFRVRAQESLALSLVKEITEYFHGDSGKEEAHPFRIFVVVREFLGVLDRVCKEVGMINERTVVSSVHTFPVPVNPMLQQEASGTMGVFSIV